MAINQPGAGLAIRASDFVSSLGINTHIDFAAYGYQNLQTVEASINYLGVKNIRDSAESPADAQTWLQVAQATGAKFDDYIAETSPAGMATDLAYVAQLAGEGILNFIEGGNEEDDAYSASLGNTLPITALFQQTVYATGLALKLPVINMSFGAGWTPNNDYQGDYGAVGDLSNFANYANAHTYPNVGQGTDWTMQRMNGLAQQAASKDPVITTEIGWNESQGYGQANIAKYVVQAALDGMRDGDPKTYFYALFDDGSGLFGLMNQDGTPKPAGTALHNLTTLLADTAPAATTFAPGSLNYTLAGTTSNDNALLMEKSDGSYWLSLWNENDPAHAVTLTLGGTASEIAMFNPLAGTGAAQDVKGAASITVSISDSPLIVEVVGPGGSSAGSVSPTPPPPPAPPPAPPPPVTLTPQDLAVIAPTSQTVTAGAKLTVTGASISDAWGAATPGQMTLNVWDTGNGTITMAGQSVTSSGEISVSGSLSDLNADLSGLTYSAPAAGSDSITVDVWNQAGVEAQQTIAVTISAPAAPAPTVPPAPAPAPAPAAPPGPTGALASVPPPGGTQPPSLLPPGSIGIARTNTNPVVNNSNATITATTGSHMVFIGGTHDQAILTGGTENVQAWQGYNSITTGSGNDTISIGGTGNVVNAGAGTNTINDSGEDNTIVMPGAGGGVDQIYGYVMQSGDLFDFTAALKGTGWNGTAATVGQFLHTATSGNDAIISLSLAANGTRVKVADLHDSGPVSMTTLLAQATI